MSETPTSTRSEGLRIARNSGILAVGNTIALVLGFGTSILVTDTLGPDTYGLFLGAQRFVLLFLVVAEFGLQPLLIRAVARKEDPGAMLGTVLALRVVLSFAFALIVATAAILGDYLPEHRWVLFSFVAMEIAGTFAGILMAVYEGREQMGRPTLAEILRAAIAFAGVVAVVRYGGSLAAILAVYFVARLVQLVGALALTPRGLHLRVERQRFAPLLVGATPFVAIAFADMALRSVDVIMLARFSSIPEASRYGAALNFVEALFILPILVQRALLPAFSRLHLTGGASEVARYTLVMASGLLLPAGAGMALLADQAVAFYPSGEFAAAAPVLQVLSATLAFMGIKMVYAMFLTGSGHLWRIVGAYVITLPIQIITNFLLMPTYGAVGVAAGTLFSQAAAAVALVVAARGLGMSFPIASVLRHALAVAAMVLPVILTRHLLIPIPMLCGGLVYVGVLLVISPATSIERRLAAQLFAHWRRR